MELTNDLGTVNRYAHQYFFTQDPHILDKILSLCTPHVKFAVSQRFANLANEDQEDIVQLALMDIVRLLRGKKRSGERCWEPRGEYDHSFVPLFFHQVCRNFLVNMYNRRYKRRPQMVSLDNPIEQNARDTFYEYFTGGQDFVEDVIYNQIVAAFLERLEGKNKEVFKRLLRGEGLTDIAREFGIRPEAIRQRLDRIRTRLVRTREYRELKQIS